MRRAGDNGKSDRRMIKNAESDDLRHFAKVVVAEWRQVGVAAVVAVTLGVTGCATLPDGQAARAASPEARADLVRQRAEARWDALMKGDVKAAYQYLSPASRAVTTLERYQAKINPAAFRAIKIERVTCEGDGCRVRLWLTFDHRLMKQIETPIDETWVFDGGQAWFVYRE